MSEIVEQLSEIALAVRARRPLVHYIPNLVTANDAANALLAVGASPVMAVAPEEVGVIPRDALALNLGTPTAERVAVLEQAGRAAAAVGTPIVLDPVGAGATPFRLASAHRLASVLPLACLRLNAGEAAALLVDEARGRGVDAGEVSAPTVYLARALAERWGCVAAVTGATDAISDGQRTLLIDNGHPLLTRLTGAGCMVTGVVAACAAVAPDPLLAAAAALLLFGVAGEVAARSAAGPGSLRAALFDALDACTVETLRREGRARWA